jgi:hypothetical protein
MHFDWGASQFLTKQFQIGLVGYVYDQAGCDRGSGDRVGCFQSRVLGVGLHIRGGGSTFKSTHCLPAHQCWPRSRPMRVSEGLTDYEAARQKIA